MAGGRGGMENYIRVTHAVNPFWDGDAPGGSVSGARLCSQGTEANANIRSYMVKSIRRRARLPHSRLAERLEEVGLYFEIIGAADELSLYRQRIRRADGRNTLQLLESCARRSQRHSTSMRP